MILLQDGHELIDHQTSSTPPLLIKMPVLSQETDLSDMCLEFAFVSKIFQSFHFPLFIVLRFQ